VFFYEIFIFWVFVRLLDIRHVVKTKEFLKRPGLAQRVPGGLGSRIS
jgi:hypothetical protein